MSAGRTILSNNVANDRIITKFPPAFHPDATPYQKMNFHPKVRGACAENRTGRVGLKICKAVLVGDVSVGKTSLVNRAVYKYAVVEFPEEEGVEVVPWKWLKGNKKECLWPNFKAPSKITKAVTQLMEPNSDFSSLPVRVLYETDDYTKARSKLTLATEKSDLQTEAEEENVEKKRSRRFCHDVFDRDYKATIGVDFEVEKFSVLSVPFTLQVWDTAGQERFKCIAASYYRGANVVMVVFDLSDEMSLSNSTRWMADACENASDPIKFLIGTKKDLVSPAAYDQTERRAATLANTLGAEFWALSSKSGENVKEFFFRAVCLTFEAAVLREIEASSPTSTKQIGNDLIKMEKEDLYDQRRGGKKNPLGKCCDT